jgi:cobalt-zinc-cadmium resistance protein CzcA
MTVAPILILLVLPLLIDRFSSRLAPPKAKKVDPEGPESGQEVMA